MMDDFEDHCWKDMVTPEILELYACYKRKIFVGSAPALLAIDLYELVSAVARIRRTKSPKIILALVATMPMRRLSRPKNSSQPHGRRACQSSTRPGTAQRQPSRLRKRYQARETVY